ncbi:hypothetical protein TYRP_016325 [Tyrophagus putrescentiae]|nr:hypothetical protein TYRP_016325 [Tyrophagus putrescentiae]
MRRAACRLAVYLALYGAVVLVSLTGDCLLRLARPTAPVLHVAALRDTLLCALLSAAIDLDHLLAARSFSIQRLTTLSRRPVLHNTSLLLSISTAAFLLGHLLSLLTDINFFGTDKTLAKSSSSSSSSMSWATRFGYLLLMATLTHHLRDGLRRGLNLWPVPVRGGSSCCCSHAAPSTVAVLCTAADTSAGAASGGHLSWGWTWAVWIRSGHHHHR